MYSTDYLPRIIYTPEILHVYTSPLYTPVRHDAAPQPSVVGLVGNPNPQRENGSQNENGTPFDKSHPAVVVLAQPIKWLAKPSRKLGVPTMTKPYTFDAAGLRLVRRKG